MTTPGFVGLGVEQGPLAFMVGGDATVQERVRPYLLAGGAPTAGEGTLCRLSSLLHLHPPWYPEARHHVPPPRHAPGAADEEGAYT